MSFGIQIAGPNRPLANNRWSNTLGRFTVDIEGESFYNEEFHTSGHYPDFWIGVVVRGGLWVNSTVSMGGWKGEIRAYLEYKNGFLNELVTFQNPWHGETSSAPSGALFGDRPGFDQGLTWLPMIDAHLILKPHNIQDLLTGKADILLETGLRAGWDSFHGISNWTSFSLHELTTNNQCNPTQFVIKASKDIPQKIISLLKSVGGVMIDLGDHHHDTVTKSEFDAFWKNLFLQYGNDTPQAQRASVLAWVSRPSFVNEPQWQAVLCFAIAASLGQQ